MADVVVNPKVLTFPPGVFLSSGSKKWLPVFIHSPASASSRLLPFHPVFLCSSLSSTLALSHSIGCFSLADSLQCFPLP